ncbi:hypothetical protein ScalyP_jg11292 [Parmales sp. scaly parma]|nr:hypothetical protein ScalyP_jg11292 [Parmales sp. scaly parma]
MAATIVPPVAIVGVLIRSRSSSSSPPTPATPTTTYRVSVMATLPSPSNSPKTTWHLEKRYNDFYALSQDVVKTVSRYCEPAANSASSSSSSSSSSTIATTAIPPNFLPPFPAKTPSFIFANDRDTLQFRQDQLETYLQALVELALGSLVMIGSRVSDRQTLMKRLNKLVGSFLELGENWLETKTGKIKVWEAVDPGFMAGERLKLGGGIGGCGGEREAAMVTVTNADDFKILAPFSVRWNTSFMAVLALSFVFTAATLTAAIFFQLGVPDSKFNFDLNFDFNLKVAAQLFAFGASTLLGTTALAHLCTLK